MDDFDPKLRPMPYTYTYVKQRGGKDSVKPFQAKRGIKFTVENRLTLQEYIDSKFKKESLQYSRPLGVRGQIKPRKVDTNNNIGMICADLEGYWDEKGLNKVYSAAWYTIDEKGQEVKRVLWLPDYNFDSAALMDFFLFFCSIQRKAEPPQI